MAADDAEDFDAAPFAEILDEGKFWKHGKSSSPTVYNDKAFIVVIRNHMFQIVIDIYLPDLSFLTKLVS